jgi:hypothetical protein
LALRQPGELEGGAHHKDSTMTYLRTAHCLALATTLLIGTAATAEEADGKCSDAKDCLAQGLKLSQAGDQAAALAAFQRSNELEPSRLALFQIAMTYKAMDKVVEADDALDKVLADSGSLKGEYVKRARAAKQETQAKVGLVDVKANVAAAIEVDGQRKGTTPLKPLRVAAGDHEVSATAPGYLPTKQTTTVAGEGRTAVSFDLQPDPAKLAQVTVASSLAGAEIRVDDEIVGTTPLSGPVKLAPGKHTFELRRPGYMDGYRQVTLTPGARVTVAFNPDEDESDSADRGRLVIAAGVPGVRVTVDGRARGVYKKPISLPAGPHVVGITHPDYEPVEKKVDVSANGETELSVSLRPGKTIRAKEADQENTRKGWATAAIVTGAVIAAGSTGLIIWGQSQLPAANDKLSLVQKDAAPGGQCDPAHLNVVTARTCQESMASAQDDVDKYKSLRLGGIIGASAGVVLVGVGVALWLTHPAAAPGDKAPEDEAMLGPFMPVVFADPTGATFGLRGRF